MLSLGRFFLAIQDAIGSSVCNGAQTVNINRYVPVTYARGTAIGVAVRTQPDWSVQGSDRRAIGPYGVGAPTLHPTALCRDDGQAYLYWGKSNPNYVKI